MNTNIPFNNLSTNSDKLHLISDKVSILDTTLILYKIDFLEHFIICEDGILINNYNDFLKIVGEENSTDNDWGLIPRVTEGDDSLNSIKFIECDFELEPKFKTSKFSTITFENCIFNCDIHNLFKKFQATNRIIIFNNCTFSRIILSSFIDNKKMTKFELYGGEITEFEVLNNTIDVKFYINQQYHGNNLTTKIDSLIIKDSIFKENFKLHNCEINNIRMVNTNFEKKAEFQKSVFKNYLQFDENSNDTTIYFKTLNFDSLALFTECKFIERCSFKYVTFGGSSHFIEAEFQKGLDLDYTNIQKEINFFAVKGLDREESKKNTSQETYRIIKYNFQKIGNQIEANKYHSLELDIHRQTTWNKILKRNLINRFFTETSKTLELLSDGLVSFFHFISSNHSRTWIVPIFWILIVGFFTNICMECPKIQFSFMDMFKYISIANFDECLKNHYVVFFLNKISLGYLYYQFIIATRKNTKK